MATLAFDHIPRAPRRAVKRVRAIPAASVPLSAPTELGNRRSTPASTFAVIGVIAGLHIAGIVALSGSKSAPVKAPTRAPIMISLAPPQVTPPPPPPPPKAAAPTPRAKAPAPARAPAPQLPVVARDTPMTDASTDTVQVAQAPVAATPDPAPAAPPAAETITEPRGYAGYLRNPAPEYPLAAQKRGLEGQVVLKVHVLSSGQPDSVTVARSSGHAILDEAALKAVLQWAFAPARRGQTPIDGWVQVPLNFKI